MRKYTLIKFYRGEATEDEVDSITAWVNKSPDNKEYFAKLKAIYTATRKDTVIDISLKKTKYSDIFISNKLQRGYKKIGSRILYLSSVAAIATIFFTLGYFIKQQSVKTGSEDIIAIAKNPTPIIRTLYTEKGVKGFTQLPDSSKVWLNSDSKIIYPQEFTGNTRNVQISGEAYFEVKKDSLHPMIINTNKDFAIEVLGTTFNVKSYENDAKVEATLYTGAITMHYKNIKTKKVETFALKPNESFSYVETENIPKSFKYKEPQKQSAWKDGQLIFNNTPMNDVLKILERWYGTKFIINNQNIYKYKLSAEFSSESIVQVLEIMQMIMPIKYTCANNVVIINKADELSLAPPKPPVNR